jgi:hypothetical protein
MKKNRSTRKKTAVTEDKRQSAIPFSRYKGLLPLIWKEEEEMLKRLPERYKPGEGMTWDFLDSVSERFILPDHLEALKK